ncbi:MAG: AAA family ATPase [Cyanobacteria bacterium P01_G01_bin.54]
MFALEGYQDVESIYTGARTLVHRAVRLQDEQPVIVKVLRNPHPHFNELVQFRNQYVITRHLEHPHILRPLALERYGNGYALVMPDRGAISLPDYWQTSQPSLPEFLAIGIQLADALHYLRQQRIIHKDIKPANILIHPDTGEIEVIDFSIASLLPKEQQQFVNPNQLEGTLAYISPEQTGRMNRGIDYRTDFYSLGITFYELLTGELPFDSDDPMDLLHSHIAKAPPPPHEQAPMPKVLSALILKLMAKNVEERYQSALGLRYDLERCLKAVEATDEIPAFPLGDRDVCDRFIIPERLYGRETEVQSLLKAFDRVAMGDNELMLVAGFSGIGKTAVVNEVHKPIVAKRGYFIKGKFDQFNRNIPFSAFVQAFRELIGQLLGESERELTRWREKIGAALGENGQVLVDVIPELEQIIGTQPPVPELSGNAAQNRFNLLFQKFIDVFTNVEHPLVMFLDDLQWADSASLNLLKVLLKDRDVGFLLLLGAYRDNEVSPNHPLMLTLAELEKKQAAISTLTLGPLQSAQINQLVAATLGCEPSLAEPLTNLVYQKTKGNPFFTTQFLKGLHEDALIAFNPDVGYWECDLIKVQDAALTDDVVEFMVGRLRKLPMVTQNVLKLAACIGNRFELETLAIVCDRPRDEVASDLWLSLQAGSVVPESETYRFFQGGAQEDDHVKDVLISYRFLHDRVQQAAYSLIEDTQKQATHLKIGQLLLQSSDDLEGEDNIFNIVNHLNFGGDLAIQTGQLSRSELARLNLQAARKAKHSTAYSAAIGYTNVGLDLLAEESWEGSEAEYQLTLDLHNEAVEAQHLCTHFEKAEELAQIVLQKAHTLLDKVKVYTLQIEALIARNQLREAVDKALNVCEALGYPLSLNAEGLKTIKPLPALEELDQFSEMVDLAQFATMRLLVLTTGPAYMSGHEALPHITLKMVNLSLEYGHSSLASYAYGMYGLVLCSTPEHIESGYHASRLSRQLLEDYDAKELTSKISTLINICRHLKEPARNSVNGKVLDLTIGIDRGLEFGDIVYAGYCALWFGIQVVFVGEPLADMETKLVAYAALMRKYKLDYSYTPVEICRQLTLNLQGQVDNVLVLTGESYDEAQLETLKTTNTMVYFFACLAKLALHYILRDYETAIYYADEAIAYEAAAPASVPLTHYRFYETLTRLAVYSPDAPLAEQAACFERVITNLETMAIWAQTAPMNYQHKYNLMLAQTMACLAQHEGAPELYEQSRVIAWAKERGYAPETGTTPESEADRLQQQYEGVRTWAASNGHSPRQSHPKTAAEYHLAALTHYEQTIMGANHHGFIQDEALANELAAQFYLAIGKEKAALGYMQDAYYCYSRWGAKAKTDDLEICYPQLLEPILQQTLSHSFSVLETVSTLAVTDTRVSTHAASQVTRSSSSTTINASLDFATILRAAQVLTSTIELDLLIDKLTQIILQNSGGDRGVLVLPDEEGHWSVKAIATPDGTQICRDSLEESMETLPVKLIQYAKNTRKTVLINDAYFDGPIVSDYVLKHQPRSGFCLPLLNQGQLMGVLYLENRLVSGVFTHDRQTVINFLSSQAAIALQNAQLYGQVQQTLQDLQQTQLQLVQNEKMSALGNLVAGVAHEINNPTGFLRGNIQPAKDYVQDLFSFVDFLLDKLPTNDPELQDEMEEMDLDFIREDLPKILNSMTLGVDRIRNISNSLRVFSRKDQDYKTAFSLHEGIESTLLILKHRTKANEQRPQIQILKDYGELPEVQCFPGQLNQVFMNLLANAVDAFDEANQGRSFAEIEADPNCITIRTRPLTGQQVQIQIQDNGCGMSPKTKERIFEQGFTTKGVGKGTGLGMAIAHQIVTGKHQGTIDCTSELGQGTTFTITLPLQ